jgi:hypothetical protein
MHSNQTPTMMTTMPSTHSNYSTPILNIPISTMVSPLNTTSHFNTGYPTTVASSSSLLTSSMPGMQIMPISHTGIPSGNSGSSNNMGVLDESTLASAYLSELERQHLEFLIDKIPMHLRRALLGRWLQ